MPDWLLPLAFGAALGIAFGLFVGWRVRRKLKRIADL